jgi:predicted Zn-dependent protease
MRHALLLVAIITCVSADPRDALAQEAPLGRIAIDPQELFDQFIGQHAETDQEELERIQIPLADERAFGTQAFEQFAASLRSKNVRITKKGPDVRRLQKLIQKIRPYMKNADRYRKITVYIADSQDTDARSFPGGTLVIFRGMMEFAENEGALVGVLGHELSHVDHGHQLRYLRLMRMAESSFPRRGPQPAWREMMTNGMFLARSMARPFRAEDETQADADGATWAFRAGYDPMDMARLFQHMAERDGNAGNMVPEFLRSHPYHENRFQAIVQLSQQLQEEAERAK